MEGEESKDTRPYLVRLAEPALSEAQGETIRCVRVRHKILVAHHSSCRVPWPMLHAKHVMARLGWASGKLWSPPSSDGLTLPDAVRKLEQKGHPPRQGHIPTHSTNSNFWERQSWAQSPSLRVSQEEVEKLGFK